MRKFDAYDGRAEDYAAYRPAYAQEAITALVELTGLDATWVVADVGSGTGNLARHLVGLAGRTIAIEPNDEMRHQAESALGRLPTFTSIDATAENTTLADASVDLVTAGQALHWFDPIAAKREFARILRPPNRIAVVWNQFDDSETTDTSAFLDPGSTEHLSFPVTLSEPWEAFIGGARSAASTPLVGDRDYGEFEAAHRKAFESCAVDGRIEVRYTTELRVGRLVQ